MSTLSKRAWALDLLGLDANATVDEIKTAYRDLVSIWHPDKHQDNARNLKRAEEMIKRLNAARDVLIYNGDIPSDWASESARTQQEEPKQGEKYEEKSNFRQNNEEDRGQQKAETVGEDNGKQNRKHRFISNQNQVMRALSVSIFVVLTFSFAYAIWLQRWTGKADEKQPSLQPTKSSNPAQAVEEQYSSTIKRPSRTNGNVLGAYTDYIQKHGKRLSSDDVRETAEAIIGWSLEYDVDARLVVALISTTSGFDPTSFSSNGAKGLGHLTFEIQQEFGVENPYNINENIFATVRYLKRLLDKYKVTESNLNKLQLVLAEYKQGPEVIRKFGGMPPDRDTQTFVGETIELYNSVRGL